MGIETVRRLAAETLGTAFLLATVVGSGIMAADLAGIDVVASNTALALLANAVATGAMLVVLIATLGPISGAHFNPAVTLGMALRRRIGFGMAGLYVVCQVVGGIIGVVAAHAMFGLDLAQASSTARTGASQWFAEGVATFGLVFFIFLGVRYRPEGVAWIVGLYITGAYFFTASTSFANPAVTIARAFSDTFAGIDPAHVAGFIAAQLMGAVLATGAAALLEGEPES